MSPRGSIRASSVTRALAIIGDRWTLMILGQAFVGVHRFSEWRTRIGIASNILSDRLKRLIASGCMHKGSGAQDPSRAEYRLTDKGRDLYPVALMEWWFERRWSGSRLASTLTHTACGARMHPKMVCAHCRREVKAWEVSWREGRGAGHDPQLPPRLTRRASDAARGGASRGLLGESVELLGDHWTRVVVASAFLGMRRYDEMQREWRIATNILTDRLRRLVDSGVMQRRLYRTGPDRYEYVLTPKGLDLYPVVLTMLAWGDRWLGGKGGPPVLLRHRPCGRRLVPLVVCDRCGEELRPDTVNFRSPANESR